MLKIDRKIMDKEEFDKIKSSLIKDLKNVIKFDFTIELREAYSSDDSSCIVISVDKDNVEALISILYSEDNKLDGIEKKYSEEYGEFSFMSNKKEKHDISDVEIGDLVAIDGSGMDYDVGIVTSISKDKDKKKLFGCGYFVVAFERSLFARRDAFCSEITITKENYGGYHSGFAKKLTSKEATDMLNLKIDKEYSELKQKLEQDKVFLKKVVKKSLDGIEKRKIFDVVVPSEKTLEFKENFGVYGLNIEDLKS